MKRTIFLLTLLAAVTMSAKAYEVGDWINLDGISYYVRSETEVEVYYVVDPEITDVVIPKTVYGYRVTSIGNGAFEESTGIRTVKLPAGINKIGSRAFEDCSNLTEVTLPAESGVTEIEDYTFSGCTSLTEITIPPSVSKIGSHTFDGCNSLTTVNIFDLSAWCNIDFYPDYKGSYEYVYSNPLASNENAKLCLNGELITDLVIPEDVTEVKPGAFNFYKGLKSVTVHPGLAKIGEKSFNWCDNLEAVHISDLSAWCRIDFDYNTANPLYYAHSLYLNGELVTDLIIPDGITEVKDYAFYGCSGLTSVTIQEGVTSIGSFAFSGCSGLTSVTIPEGVTSIGSYAFSGCSGLTSVTIPQGVTSIGESAFYECSGLTSVTIPQGVTSIGSFAFDGCSGLTSVTIPSSITSIGTSAFRDCDNLEKVYISDLSAWCKIDFGYSNDCNPLWNGGDLILNGLRIENLVIPEDITVVKDYAFEGCKVKSVTIHSGVISFGSMGLYRYNDLVAVYISDLSAWCRIDFKSNTFGISHKLYLNGIQVIDLVIPDDVTSIKNYAFSGCSGLTSVTIPDGVTSIGNSAFSRCSGLTSVTIPEGVTSIGDSVFYGCSGLTSVTIPEGVTSIGDSAFSYCSGLTSVTIPEGVTSIGGYAFYGCSGLTSVTIPESVTSIGDSAFQSCSGLTSIVLGDGIEEFGGNSYDNAFYGCDISEIILLDDSFEYLNKIEGIADGANVYGFIYGADAPSGVRYRQLELDIPDYTYTGHGPEYISVLENTSSYRIECTGVDGDESIDVGSHDATTAEVCVYNKDDAGSRPTTYHVTLPKKYSYTVNKAPLTVTAESFSVDYGETVAADDFWYSYSGFVNGEDEDVLTELPVIECEAASIPEAGEYPITVSGGEAKNYEFKYEQGTLTVLQIPQTMVWDQDLSDLSVGDMVVLTAEASSGMPVSYSVSNGDVVEIVKSGGKMRLHCLSPGTVTVTATEQESRNYLPVSLEKEVKVTAFGGVGTVDAGAVGCYPNPAVERLNVTGTADGSVIRIFDLDGRLLGTLKGEDGTTAVDVSWLAQGDYLLVVETGGKTATLRFTKK